MSVVDSIVAVCPLSIWSGGSRNCRWCDSEITNSRRRTWCKDACRRAFERNHVWRKARAYARRKAKYVCSIPDCEVGRPHLEVHHIDPRDGRGYAVGCHAHQDNLQVLCKYHHSLETEKHRALKRQVL